MFEANSKSLIIDGTLRQSIDVFRHRLYLMMICVFLCYVTLIFRLFDLSISGQSSLEDNSDNRTNIAASMRGEIVDRNDVLLATNLPSYSLYANPSEMIDGRVAAKKLHKIMKNTSLSKLQKRLDNPSKKFVWIKRHVHPKVIEKVNKLGLVGVYFVEEQKRTYPQKNLLSHIVGFVDIDGEGKFGAEKSFHSRLNSGEFDDKPLKLTIDLRVQYLVHEHLKKAFKDFKAKAAVAIVMDANNGEIISSVSLPDFDPNHLGTISSTNQMNLSYQALYEMGSTFKTFTIAQALDENLVNTSSKFDVRKPITHAGFTINDHHKVKNVMTVPEIFTHSSNIGTAKIVDIIGIKRQREFFEKLGLFDYVQTDLTERAHPLYPKKSKRLNSLTMSYGHGISVTPIHMVRAFASIVNGGKLVQPHVIERDNIAKGDRVIKVQTSTNMQKLLRNVVEKGTARKANSEGYPIGAKTGTAEKPGKYGYSEKRMVSSLISAFPIDDPKYVVLVLLDEPKGNKSTHGYATAGWVAAPVVKNIVDSIGPILNIRPVSDDIQQASVF